MTDRIADDAAEIRRRMLKIAAEEGRNGTADEPFPEQPAPSPDPYKLHPKPNWWQTPPGQEPAYDPMLHGLKQALPAPEPNDGYLFCARHRVADLAADYAFNGVPR